MVEVIGDIVMPSELIIVDKTGDTFTSAMSISGAHLFLSGNKLMFIENAALHQITST